MLFLLVSVSTKASDSVWSFDKDSLFSEAASDQAPPLFDLTYSSGETRSFLSDTMIDALYGSSLTLDYAWSALGLFRCLKVDSSMAKQHSMSNDSREA